MGVYLEEVLILGTLSGMADELIGLTINYLDWDAVVVPYVSQG